MGVTHMDPVRVALLAFADDVDLLANTTEMAATTLEELCATLRRASMDLQPSKMSMATMPNLLGLGGAQYGGTPCRV